VVEYGLRAALKLGLQIPEVRHRTGNLQMMMSRQSPYLSVVGKLLLVPVCCVTLMCKGFRIVRARYKLIQSKFPYRLKIPISWAILRSISDILSCKDLTLP
jgi:hypothetical protein